MQFIQVYDPGVSQYAYILGCEQTKQAIVIDPQRHISQYLQIAENKGLKIVAVTETHIHADFLSGTQEFVKTLGIQAYLSSHGEGHGWAYEWAKNQDNVKMVKGGDTISIGEIKLDIVHTPGHTPEHITFLITTEEQEEPMGAITGDFVFVGDLGRPDLLEKAAKQDGEMKKGAEALFKSARSFKKRPDHLLIWPGHGAGSACGKSLGSMPHSSWGYEKLTSEALQYDEEQDFIDFITDAQKEPPLYFARMKDLNKNGTPPLKNNELRELAAQQLQAFATDNDLLFIDIRGDRVKAMNNRSKNVFYASFVSMSTAVGSMIEDVDVKIILIGPKNYTEEAAKRLNNIGYDNIEGFAEDNEFTTSLKDDEKASIPVIDFKTLSKKMKENNLTIVDVRSQPEYNNGHIDGAINAPYTRLPEYLDNLPTGKILYVHCGSGQRASISSSYLKMQGYDVVLINDVFSNVKNINFYSNTAE